MTGPLAPLFAQVLEEHELGLQAEWWGFSERVEARRRFDAALSAIERHVQDMEKITRRVAGMADDEWPENTPGNRLALAQLIADARAALPASGTPEGDAR